MSPSEVCQRRILDAAKIRKLHVISVMTSFNSLCRMMITLYCNTGHFRWAELLFEEQLWLAETDVNCLPDRKACRQSFLPVLASRNIDMQIILFVRESGMLSDLLYLAFLLFQERHLEE